MIGITYNDWKICLFNLFFLAVDVLGNGESTTSVPSTTPDSTMSSAFSRRREVRRHHRVNSIRQNVMDMFGWLTVPTVDSQARRNFLDNLNGENRNATIYEQMTIEQEMCYPAKCSVPFWINRSTWNSADSMSMNFYFDVLQASDPNTRVKNATLYLFVKSKSDCHCSDAETSSVRLIVTVYQHHPYGIMFSRRGGERIRVPVNPERRKRLLSMKLVLWSTPEVIDFDVTEAVYFWVTRTQMNQDANQQHPYLQRRGRRRHRPRRNQWRLKANFGLEVTVDKYYVYSRGTEQYDVSNVFTAADCSQPFDVACIDPELANRMRPTPILHVWTEITPDFSSRNKRSADELQATETPPTTQSMLLKSLNGGKEKDQEFDGKT